ncbi:MAG: hypothetical protein JWM68_4377 [Verrucomicrobiales bacterium]|nr:hypothetical protein [Verrucomicrobiales bacterium]
MKPSSYSLILGVALLAGCATQNATYVDPNGTHTLATVNKINIQDWSNAAETMINSLLDSGKVQTHGTEPAILAISRILNNTTEQIDIDMLTKKMRVALNKSGKMVTTTTQGLGGAEDPLAKGLQDQEAFIKNTKVTRNPDYTLSGKIIEDRARVGNVRQASYIFQLSLSSSDGLAVWEEEKTITKQGTKPAAGW